MQNWMFACSYSAPYNLCTIWKPLWPLKVQLVCTFLTCSAEVQKDKIKEHLKKVNTVWEVRSHVGVSFWKLLWDDIELKCIGKYLHRILETSQTCFLSTACPAPALWVSPKHFPSLKWPPAELGHAPVFAKKHNLELISHTWVNVLFLTELIC